MDKSEVSLDRMRTFIRVAERNNLSAVAREMRTGQSTVTRHIRELEAAVGTALLSRTTRRVVLTDEGRRYYASCLEILRLVDQAVDDLRYAEEATTGTVRLSCTAALGVLHVAPLIFEFQDKHPGIEVDLSLTDERIDLVGEGVDFSIRLGPLTNSTLKLRNVGVSERLLVASPSYLAENGWPTKPSQLSEHQTIRMSNVAGSDVLSLIDPSGEAATWPVGGKLRVDHGLAARQAFLAGRGIGPAHRWLVDDALADGRLCEVLHQHRLAPTALSMLIVPERAAIARVRLVAEFLMPRLRALPGISH